MADLSGVLRKTIDGLPRATPQMRQKVYEKARAAIQRQIDAANPPLAEGVVSARLAALEDAISRTEDHYIEQEQASAGETPPPAAPTSAPEPQAPAQQPKPAAAPRAEEPAAAPQAPQPKPKPAPPAAQPAPATPQQPEQAKQPEPPKQAAAPAAEKKPPQPAPQPPAAETAPAPKQGGQGQRPQSAVEDTGSDAPAEPPQPSQPKKPAASEPQKPKPADKPAASAAPATPAPVAMPSMSDEAPQPDERAIGRSQDEPDAQASDISGQDGPQPFIPAATEEPEQSGQPPAIGAPFILPAESGEREPVEADDEEPYHFAERRQAAHEGVPRDVRVDDDDGIPEADITAPRYPARRSRSGRGRSVATAAIVLLILGGLGTAGWIFRDDIEALLVEPAGIGTIADQAAEPDTPVQGVATPEGEPTEAATSTSDESGTQLAANQPSEPESTRRFTQRLLPDGTEVDAGPAEPMPNAFDEGTNIAAAESVTSPSEDQAATPTVQSTIGEDPAVVGADDGDANAVPGVVTDGNTDAASSAEDAGATEDPASDAGADNTGDGQSDEAGQGTETAALDVAQKAVFYQERTGDLPGTQESGNVVWSVIEEPPVEGQPPEPAIRAVADVPDENLKMTMTIKRNADPTLPASHVIELEFDTPADFSGGSVTNVQRLALKDTEQARGEPLIGVAGKISDGFFIIALNNLDQAVQNNLALLESEQWIDIPLAYATGRRALISIEKGIPGDRVFKQALQAWDAKT